MSDPVSSTPASDRPESLEQLIAVDAIKRLKARFFLAVDQKDWASYAALFTDDARFDVASAFEDDGGSSVVSLGGAEAAVGGAAMAEVVAQALEGIATAHIGHMPIIELISRNEAQAIWPVEDWLWFAEGAAPPFLHGFGHYDEVYRRTANGWRIARLRYTRRRFA